MDIEIDQEEKSLLVAGDPDSIISILLRLYQLDLEMSLAKETRDVPQRPSDDTK